MSSLFYRANDQIDGLFIGSEIYIRRVDTQYWELGIGLEKTVISSSYVTNVVRIHILFVDPASFGNSIHNDVVFGVKINHHIRCWTLHRENIEETFIKVQFLVFQGELCENVVLFKKVIRKRETVKQVSLAEMLLLTESRHQEKDLSRKRKCVSITIKIRQKRIVLELFVDLPCLETSSELFDQSGFAHSNDALYGDILRVSAGF